MSMPSAKGESKDGYWINPGRLRIYRLEWIIHIGSQSEGRI